MTAQTGNHVGWWQILRLGLVQACLGAVVVTTSTPNWVMVVEPAPPALLAGTLVALHDLVQAVAFGIGGLLGAAASDLSRRLIGSPGAAYALVFALEGLLFLVAAGLAWRVAVPATAPQTRAASRHHGTLNPANDFGAVT